MKKPAKPDRRSDALSKDRIVEAAIEILDAEGEAALTFRALAAKLSTGAGAIYWHVADKNHLLAAAAEGLIAKMLSGTAKSKSPRESVRAIALGVFDAIDAHPWVGAQMSRQPWQLATLQIYEALGSCLIKLGVPQRALFEAWSTLINYILGVAGENAANARHQPPDANRSALLAEFAERWASLNAEKYPFGRLIAKQLSDHDDREQFLAGIDIILAGIKTLK